MARLYARTNAEAHLYMDLRPCACGDVAFDRQSAATTEGDVLCSRYAGPCRGCGAHREFVFELPEAIRPIRGHQVDFGGDEPSRLLDPGEWMAVADYFAKLDPGTPDDLDTAAAAVEEILKFVPVGAEQVPDEAFLSERGRAVRDAEPGRFRRSRLAAVLGAYRELLAKAVAPVAPVVAARPLEHYPLEALVEAVAQVAVRQHGFDGADLRQHAADLAGQLRSVLNRFQIKAKEEVARRQTTVEVERLLASIARTDTAAGKAIAAHQASIAEAFRGVDLTRISDGLQVLVAWMRNPTDDKIAPVQELIASLEALVVVDPRALIGQLRPLLIGATIAIPDLDLRAIAGADVGDVGFLALACSISHHS